MRKVKRVGQQQRKSSRAGYQSSTADGPPGGEHRRRPSEQEQALTQKNYRLAKELSELRVRLRDEMRTVTKLTMENMNLGSRCREHMSENLHLRRELSALQQNKNFSHVSRPQQRSTHCPQSNSPPVSLTSIAATSPPLSPTQESYPQHHNDAHKRQSNGSVSPRHQSMPPPDGSAAQPVRQPRRPVSNSFDDLNEDHLRTQTQLPQRSHGMKILEEKFDGISSKDVFSNAIEVIPRPDSPIEVLDEPDEFEKWTQITPPSPPVSPGRRQSPRSIGKSSISFTPELLGDEKLPGAAFGTPEQNAFGDFIGPSHGSPSFGRSFKQKSEDDFDDVSLNSQQAFDASFAMAFPNTFDAQTHKPEEPPSLPSQDFGDSDIFSDEDPFFPPYKVSERNRYPSSNSDVGQEQRQANGHTNTAKSDPHTSEVNAKSVPVSPRPSNSASSPKNPESEIFPVSPLDELDQIAMSSFAMTSMSTEATVGNNLDESKGITKEELVAPSGHLPKTAGNTSARERYIAASESTKKKEIASKINRKSPSSSHSPSLVLRRLHQRRAQEKEQKALKEAAAASPTNSISPSDESSPRSQEVHSPRSNGLATQTALVSGMFNVITDEDKQGPAVGDDTSFSDSPSDEGGNITGKRDENESSSPKQEVEVVKIQEDSTILDTTRGKEGGPSSSIFKATHPSRGKLPNQNTSHSEDVAPSSSPKNVECSDRSKETAHKLPSNSIQAEIRRLDAIATSQANSTSSNPLSGRRSTRSVKHPISYKEPSVGAKLRQGDIFFPRKEEKDAEIDNQNPAKNAGEVLQDLAES
mmetsp:Transcript_7670/g.11274  ORF Transcript_7670/g.11274 Transcript_7670/m.11274 type:complete len:808 (-) Transcript_7670:83-2506(-)|eukprot:CAMPEP_0196820424 /NCGR_PEP_ID=MMETSP1362-20130617/75192_1 /TAXON_ID=163516 /ORGANISM="Leptocylindrus danicus, Strain CCMP1856" /LENGTH=807 /DNA_ID=CAMNT_0042199303 /DNA_START=71 /DNA_END=2494 /DNA_ORIENTATION=+